jgi:hypothetical protein
MARFDGTMESSFMPTRLMLLSSPKSTQKAQKRYTLPLDCPF